MASTAAAAGAPVNMVATRTGRVRVVCEFCGRTSRPVSLTPGGRPDLWDLAPGWGEAPYSPGFVHEDGSTGSLWDCPSCARRLRGGEALRTRGGQLQRRVG